MAVKHKQKSELKVQRDCHSTDKIYCCNSPWLWRPKEKKHQIYRHFSVYLYMKREGEANHLQREGKKGNKVSFHVRVSQFIQQDSVIAGFCFWSPLFVYWHFAMLLKNCTLGPEIARERGIFFFFFEKEELRWENLLDCYLGKECFSFLWNCSNWAIIDLSQKWVGCWMIFHVKWCVRRLCFSGKQDPLITAHVHDASLTCKKQSMVKSSLFCLPQYSFCSGMLSFFSISLFNCIKFRNYLER